MGSMFKAQDNDSAKKVLLFLLGCVYVLIGIFEIIIISSLSIVCNLITLPAKIMVAVCSVKI